MFYSPQQRNFVSIQSVVVTLRFGSQRFDSFYFISNFLILKVDICLNVYDCVFEMMILHIPVSVYFTILGPDCS